jgi:hypothetical protein
MTAIGGVKHIVAAIRAEMSSSVQARSPGRAGAPARQAKAKPPATSRMGRLINERVKALDPDDPQRGRKAFRIFLESVLLEELGEDLINDHNFYQLVDQVQQTMEADSHIAAAIGKAVTALLDPPAKTR